MKPRFVGRGSKLQLVLGKERVPVRLAASGSFSGIYFEQGGPRVFAVTEQPAWDKLAMARAKQIAPGNPHLPAIREIGQMGDGTWVFEMPRYRIYEQDRASLDPDQQKMRLLLNDIGTGRPLLLVAREAESELLHPDMKAALRAIAQAAKDVGASGGRWVFEAQPRNVAADDEGRLVLLDVIFYD
jgi:hypothetical protein